MTVETEVAALTSAVNLLTSTVNVSKATLDASVAAAEAAYDSFDDRYLGAKVSAPSLDNDGGSLLTGALYFNSTENAMYVYTGASWVITTNYNNVTAPYTLAQTLNTNGNNVTFGDNGKAIFGAGSDLQIYHDGTTNKVVGSIDVTGTATMDGLVVEGNTYIDTNSGADAFYVTRYGSVQNESASFVIDDGALTINSIQDEQYGSFRINSTHYGVGTATRFSIDNDGDISFYEDTGTTPKLFWDASAESLGIGTSSPSQALHVFSASDTPAIIESTDFNSRLEIKDNSGSSFIENRGGILNLKADTANAAANSRIEFSVDNSEKMRIDSSGNVGIGTSSPVSLLTVGSVSSTNHFSVARENAVITGTDVTVSATQAGMLDLLSTSLAGVGKSTSLTFTQNTSQFVAGWDKVLGAIDVELTSSANLTADSAMKFYTSAGAISSTLNERMRIDSSGNLLVGTTNNAPATNNVEGVVLRSEGHINVSRASGVVGYFNRKTDDGTILSFHKDGTNVGSIGNATGTLVVGSTDGSGSYLRFGSNNINPATSAGALRDAAIDLGKTGGRFKDLYLSGGVYLGGTGAANLLDDYEEGTWTPTASLGTFGEAAGLYVKVGDLVTVFFAINTATESTSTNEIKIKSLPFNSAGTSVSSHHGQGSVSYLDQLTGLDIIGCLIRSDEINLVRDNTTSLVKYSDASGSWSVRGTVTYKVA